MRPEYKTYLEVLKIGESLYKESIQLKKTLFYFSNEEIKNVSLFSEFEYNKLLKIFSVGNKWNEDEILQILTLFIQLKIIEICFNSLNFKLNFNINEVENMIELLKSKKNIANYNSSLRLIKRNWTEINVEDFLNTNTFEVSILENFKKKQKRNKKGSVIKTK